MACQVRANFVASLNTEIMTMTVFQHLILISIDFYNNIFYLYIFSFVLILIGKVYQTLKSVFDHISNKINIMCFVLCFNSPLSVWKCD